MGHGDTETGPNVINTSDPDMQAGSKSCVDSGGHANRGGKGHLGVRIAPGDAHIWSRFQTPTTTATPTWPHAHPRPHPHPHLQPQPQPHPHPIAASLLAEECAIIMPTREERALGPSASALCGMPSNRVFAVRA